MTSIDLSETSILLSLKIDSDQRLRNLELLLDYYATVARDQEIILVCQGKGPDRGGLSTSKGLTVHVLEDAGLHWKTRNLNRAAALSTRPYLLVTDIDMIPRPDALVEGLQRVRNGEGFVHLFDGLVVNVSQDMLDTRQNWESFLGGLPHVSREEVGPETASPREGLTPLYGNAEHQATGGGFLCRREAFFSVGGFNENFVSYGGEDQEFHLRVEKLGHSFAYLEGSNLYHLDHARGTESRYGPFYRQNMAELGRVADMEPDALRAYVDQGFREMPFEEGFLYDRRLGEDKTGWTRRPDRRRDISDLCLLIIADACRVAPEDSCLEALIDHMEETYRNPDIRICEAETLRFKYPKNRFHVVHHSIPERITAAALRTIHHETGRPSLMVIRLGSDPARQLKTLKSKIAVAALRTKSGKTVAAPRRPAASGNHAIYIHFDDHFHDHARACFNSLAINYPDHPQILVDYRGEDPLLLALIDRVGAMRLPPEPPPDFTRHLVRERARENVIARFRLWRRAFRDHDTILHLDADTLVLAPLDPLFERPEPFIVANHEPSPEIRIFRPEHRRTAELQARLRQDGITYPGHPDDMGNAGVFTLPRAFRSREHLATLASFAQRYGAYLAYADQSLVSLWLRSLGIRPTREFAYNFQTPFFTASDISVSREDIRILHFSSDRKPGTRAFEQWNRVGEAREWLVDLFEEYKSF